MTHPDIVIEQTSYIRWCSKCASYRQTDRLFFYPEGLRRCMWCHAELPEPQEQSV